MMGWVEVTSGLAQHCAERGQPRGRPSSGLLPDSVADMVSVVCLLTWACLGLSGLAQLRGVAVAEPHLSTLWPLHRKKLLTLLWGGLWSLGQNHWVWAGRIPQHLVRR